MTNKHDVACCDCLECSLERRAEQSHAASDADDEIVIPSKLRDAAHVTIDKWLNDCLDAARRRHECGYSGEVGRIRFRVSLDDSDEISIVVDRFYAEEL